MLETDEQKLKRYQQLAEQAVEETRDDPVGGFQGNSIYWGGHELGKTWGFTFKFCRDSGPLEQSNYRVIKADMEERFLDDVSDEHLSHWGFGWFDMLNVRLLDENGKITPAGIAIIEWRDSLEDYPIADEQDYFELENEMVAESFSGYIDEEHIGDVLKEMGKRGEDVSYKDIDIDLAIEIENELFPENEDKDE